MSGPGLKYDIAVRRRRLLIISIRCITSALYISLLVTVSVELLFPNYESYGYKLLNLSDDEAAILGLLFFAYYAALIIIPLVASIVFTYPRKKIVILRPFSSSILALSLRSFILRNLSGRGYIYTLGDSTFGRSYLVTFLYGFLPLLSLGRMTYSRISFLISPLIRDVISLDGVVNWNSYNALQSNINTWPTKGHSHYNAYSGGQAFTIKCSDDWWKECVTLFLVHSDVVIVDLSLVKMGSEYELEELVKLRLIYKCVFISIDFTSSLAQKVVDRYFGNDEGARLHVFRRDGRLIDYESFERDITQIVIGADQASTLRSQTASLNAYAEDLIARLSAGLKVTDRDAFRQAAEAALAAMPPEALDLSSAYRAVAPLWRQYLQSPHDRNRSF